ncbi:hypothetical protein FB466_0352 [Klugiella xanthotipulae]|uniref:DUF7919 domain-containing protein n=1 Tax=Klugiella xanthotipulae TaxID=244735 RepID=A0A543I4M4_9MICO|nr:hypothetical protein FB466_0352 [Klugiella xanthotipulae]
MPYITDGTTVGVQRPGHENFFTRLTSRNSKSSVDQYGVPTSCGPWNSFGWLDRGHDYSQGECPRHLIRTLETAALQPVFITRGFYTCRFCSPAPELGPTPYRMTDGRTIQLGFACVKIIDGQDRIWLAPTLVLHYIAEHGYLPPTDLLGRLQES